MGGYFNEILCAMERRLRLKSFPSLGIDLWSAGAAGQRLTFWPTGAPSEVKLEYQNDCKYWDLKWVGSLSLKEIISQTD